MKIRNGFVSNSSSSSFVIRAKLEEGQDKITVSLPLKIFSDKVIRTVEQLKTKYEEQYYWEDGDGDFYCQLEDNRALDKYNEDLKHIQDGGIIMEKDCEYGAEDAFISLIKASGLKLEEDY